MAVEADNHEMLVIHAAAGVQLTFPYFARV
jgi:hypothetical protein